jgi:hypothetical protein
MALSMTERSSEELATQPYGVAIVIDPNFGDRLGAIAEQMPVWIADTPANRVVAEQVRTLYSGQSHFSS